MTDADRLRDDPEALDRLIEEHRILKETVEHAPVLFCVYNSDHHLVAWNTLYENNHAEAFRLLRKNDGNAPIHYADLIRHDLVGKIPEDEIAATVAARLSVQETADGSPTVRHYERSGWTQIMKYRLPSGAMAGLAFDVNALKQREAELEEARRAAEAAERVKSGFLAKMSHEIRTPMNGILGMAESLIDTNLTSDQRQSLETILSSGDSLLALINDILDFSKIEAGKMELVLRPFSLLEEAEALGRLLMPRARALGLNLILDIDPALDVPLVGDACRIRQIITNLLGNALKFTPKGHVLMRIDGIRRVNLRAFDVTITVQDTGVGVAPEVQDSIFKPFSQLNNPLVQGGNGTGLGLSITSDLVQAMEGALTLNSVPNQGSTFQCRLRLPMAKCTHDKVARAPIRPVALTTQAAIAVIDPCSLHSNATLRALRHLGFTPQWWPSLSAWSHNRPAPAPLIVSSAALPADPHQCRNALETLTPRPERCLLVWNRSTPAPNTPDVQVLTAPMSLSAWHTALSLPNQIRVPLAEKPTPEVHHLTVLVAEDNRTNRLVLDRMLKARVDQLIFAENGQEAVEHTIAKAPDLILMDMAMPVMNGLEATRAIRAHEMAKGLAPCMIVALTANAMTSDRAACLDAGMDDFLTKPVRLERLLDQLNTLNTTNRLSA